MTPGRLFDYLDGKLNDWERSQLEAQIAKDPHLQKELATARRIHSGMRGESREVIEDSPDLERGRKLSLRVGIAFIVLIALNVGIGLFFIARHEANNPNQKLLQEQARSELTKSLQQASRNEMPPPTLDLNDVTIPAAAHEMRNVANSVADLAHKAEASATIGPPDDKEVNVFVEISSDKEALFRNALGAFSGTKLSPISPNDTTSPGTKKRMIVHIVRSDSQGR